MIEAVGNDVGDGGGEYGIEYGGDGDGENTGKDVCKIGWLSVWCFGMRIWLILSSFDVLIYDI